MRTSGLGESRGSSTSGVLPIDSTMLPKRPPQGRLRSSDMAASLSRYFKKYSPGHQPPVKIAKSGEGGSAAGHGREDDNGVALAHRCAETVQHPHVLIVEVDVDVAVEVA